MVRFCYVFSTCKKHWLVEPGNEVIIQCHVSIPWITNWFMYRRCMLRHGVLHVYGGCNNSPKNYYVHTHTHTHTCTHTHTHTHTRTHTHTHAHTHSHTHPHTYTHARTHTNTHSRQRTLATTPVTHAPTWRSMSSTTMAVPGSLPSSRRTAWN